MIDLTLRIYDGVYKRYFIIFANDILCDGLLMIGTTSRDGDLFLL